MPLLSTPLAAAQWLRTLGARTLTSDSRKVVPGAGFIAWPGAVSDGRQYVRQALELGAVACVVESAGAHQFDLAIDGVATLDNLKSHTGRLAAEFYGNPSAELAVIAVTGTNGKTSSAWWLAQALSALQGEHATPCGMIGTLGVGRPPAIGDEPMVGADSVLSTGLTTPDPVVLQHTLREFASNGLRACAIEASSIGIEEQRLAGCTVRVAVFTNFTQDHLDYHASMEAYWTAKAKLFGWPGLESAVINVDDAKGVELVARLAGSGLDVWSVSTRKPARLRAQNIQYGHEGLSFDVVEGVLSVHVATHLIGDYNVSNLLGVIGAMRCLGVPLQQATEVCSGLRPVPGRMECLGSAAQPMVAVDYAHTPDALGQALAALRPLAQARGGRLWCVFGCGGDRDASKRPLMGAIAAQQADQVVVTSDNPRSERPESIIAQILVGVPHNPLVSVQTDRALAIAQTIAQASAQDVILVAGKGHEDYQDIAHVKHPFSDREHAQSALIARERGMASPALDPLMTLAFAAELLPGSVLVGDPETVVYRVHTDTRSIAVGDLFVALQGERFDANAFLQQAKDQGAAAVICQAGMAASSYPQGLARLEVADTKLALSELATKWRARFNFPVIAVTGSNGKTTVTQMVAAILEAHSPQGGSLATLGNYNNDIGVPLTLLRLRANHSIAVVELGMNHPGEIAVLAAMARPTVALVNNAQREHLEFMHSVQAVAQENGQVLAALPVDGVAIFPSDDAYAAVWHSLAAPRQTLTFAAEGPSSSASLCVQSAHWQDGAWEVHASGFGVDLRFRLAIAGRHNVKNALAAAACALAAGVRKEAVVAGLQAFVPVKGRSRALSVRVSGRLVTLVDDSYNANPDSVRAAIDVLAELPGPRLLVLGDMGEVGDNGPAFHAEAGQYAAQAGIEQVMTLGELSQHLAHTMPSAQHFDSMDALISGVLAALPSLGSILIKGSRFMRMERVVDAARGQVASEGGH
ncbi:bifunctional UDP-N-acetylmuramoyl-L-alanyl-D-glutamate--2,6-diaminopimelate ligase MurE/UDP-N-acetylmuramoyl-tripeptide--D-alanyl-D-alanine ligase MurF [Rhodoferax aquaticus]|uniref:Multifunctional fusion protein n=1 Tax=Rhodoferax aquaticus TaxID=2527691 RepID=A0A515ELL5_9BURK|nr:bifunctional UDP-N-acetylmuramoyl-L-alanyl-D-glutamate--2,6-diaminopimelate ligase MurE/UDP-N-acetylmuramoyl-tripeptide--D-alanyl-D-alanine ligase MurF [Rhodoferax aquaticus]QDL53519.1 bifunctional UDP-N-acetylmuramoyl-L-alanyl-D-glutamate--2,6-diaminopimelate ligase MurE/UDP-N-acetylmuramoyl-tripeptide--D-alanyl-D-alanine ligase MurF [Rhodoferax aquaticus]